MKTRRIDFNFKPLQVQVSLTAENSVPDRQTYNADTGDYYPDYTLTPLTLQPRVSIVDKDEVITVGSVNEQLTNIRWYETLGGTRTQIQTTDTGYAITQSGTDAGRILVKKNVQPLMPLTLELYADYVDTRTSQVIAIRCSYLISCGNDSSQVRVELDAAEQSMYNPLRDASTQKITPTVFLGAGVCPSSKYALVWEVMDANGTWRTAGSDSVMDYWHTVNSDGTLTIDKRLMGDEAHVRCRVKYSADGTPSSVELTAASPCREASFVRRIPKYDPEITGMSFNIPPGTLNVSPQASVTDAVGLVDGFETELLPLWYMATNNSGSASLSYALVGHGRDVTFGTGRMSKSYGGVMGLDMKDRGPWSALVDESGNVLTDESGNIIVIH